MDTCPKCHRKLLVHSSKSCNWCGCVIEDAAYQEEAAKKHDAFFQQDRIQQAAEIAGVDALSPTPGFHSTGAFLQKTVFPDRHPEALTNTASRVDQQDDSLHDVDEDTPARPTPTANADHPDLRKQLP
jgi:transcription initiation factor TFIIIB Brf1 subunit/transcription initiation factor TFIIB